MKQVLVIRVDFDDLVDSAHLQSTLQSVMDTQVRPKFQQSSSERGEKLACDFLRKRGYKVLYRNFRARRGGEVDVVCRDGDTLVFVEVKTRTREDFGRPIDAVDAAKQKLITRGALAWLRLLDNPDVLFRFDVVEVMVDGANGEARLEVGRDAFQLSAP